MSSNMREPELLVISDSEVLDGIRAQARLFILQMSIGIIGTVAAKVIGGTDTYIDIVLSENFQRKGEVHLLEAHA